MSDTIATYRSLNAPEAHAWVGFIYINGKRLNIIFTADSEEEVKAKIKEFWARDKAKRDANRAKRAEAEAKRQASLQKARETKAEEMA